MAILPVETSSAILALVLSLLISFTFMVYFNKIILWKNGFGNDHVKVRNKSIIRKALWQGGWLIIVSLATNLLTFGILAIDIFKTGKRLDNASDDWSTVDITTLWRIFFFINVIINL